MAAFIIDQVPVFDIREAAGITGMLVNDAQRGAALVESLGERSAVLMRGHGATVIGKSIPVAVARSVYLEVNASIQQQAINLGTGVTYLDPDEARTVLAEGEHRDFERPWALWKLELAEQ
jgi:HCOMODA/2-hydroxy-3-carboxy-muconic semialdehyde decarboxylase